MRLEGKVALVTGAAAGIGAATARRFAAEGASVALSDVRTEAGAALAETLNANGQRACFVPLDVASESQWEEAVAHATERFGAPTVLVNNAGIYALRLIEDTSPDELDRMMEVNVKGVFLGIKAVLPGMRAAGGGSIVNLSSVAGPCRERHLVGLQRLEGCGANPDEVRGAPACEGRHPLQLGPSLADRHRHGVAVHARGRDP